MTFHKDVNLTNLNNPNWCNRHNQPMQSEWCKTCDIAARKFPFDTHYKDHPLAIEQREQHHREVKIAQARLNKTPTPPKRSYSNKPS